MADVIPMIERGLGKCGDKEILTLNNPRIVFMRLSRYRGNILFPNGAIISTEDEVLFDDLSDAINGDFQNGSVIVSFWVSFEWVVYLERKVMFTGYAPRLPSHTRNICIPMNHLSTVYTTDGEVICRIDGQQVTKEP